MTTCHRASNEANYRTSAYEAISAFVSNAPPDTIPVVQSTLVTILQRMEHLLGVQVCNFTDRKGYHFL
jgi:importin subunit beta-1